MKVQPDRSTEPVMPVQPSKALSPMEVIPDRLHTPYVSLLNVLRLVQYPKQPEGMVFIVSILVGHVTLAMLVRANAESPTEVIPVRSHTPSVSLLNVLRFVQVEKQLWGMVFT